LNSFLFVEEFFDILDDFLHELVEERMETFFDLIH
jgi:hypothetical protein